MTGSTTAGPLPAETHPETELQRLVAKRLRRASDAIGADTGAYDSPQGFAFVSSTGKRKKKR